jgi:hypothetical protein
MNEKEVIISQYLASLEMLKQAVEHCPEDFWLDENLENPIWQTVFHVLFFTHLYLQSTREDFVPWEKHEEAFVGLGESEEEAQREPYSQAEMLEYLSFCQEEVKKRTVGLDLEAESGFHWLPFNKLELQFYNIRHIQHHTGEVYRAVQVNTGEDVLKWVGMIKPEN